MIKKYRVTRNASTQKGQVKEYINNEYAIIKELDYLSALDMEWLSDFTSKLSDPTDVEYITILS